MYFGFNAEEKAEIKWDGGALSFRLELLTAVLP